MFICRLTAVVDRGMHDYIVAVFREAEKGDNNALLPSMLEPEAFEGKFPKIF